MKKALLIAFLFPFVGCKKNNSNPTYGTVNYTYQGKSITTGNASAFADYYNTITGKWSSLEGNLGIGTGYGPYAFFQIYYVQIPPSYTTGPNSDSVALNYLYHYPSTYNGIFELPPFMLSKTLGSNNISADSASFMFTSFQNGLASGTFYMRAHITLPTGAVVADSMTNGSFSNVPIQYNY